ncbi:2-keto-4-pentenoate hydratase/2-oxohepta-3-ene-1,7-dioic acid hydratase (catechol pathway) [Tistlia consotensis]|uniref:2-keto-4-pentenoate hydratase/2-oxohepta-3-ene-1,7-dioic acid hydratase (Catechol pathway) n=1 Tax=Tistlia consotensis USBA 355 TaxID=560819 RepID=A0A1Y6CBA9_9PROT|nr:fumarylacetoacetate hydrolase family protein [Tistlia consotensis]SMF55072.1 2-keto-4-pentenoate hydratase/2-oxohepta-3-ene-1,7-dioic acid hydratase (catechol pathway) [Tistlia consotensis USBA 355]SNR87610.1 2-keto-4-pentenoate hydratase/2-oxohepta-3-ene-1,7-dioic acid hydratase (catechol pathway) [Tistlia consotensis]
MRYVVFERAGATGVGRLSEDAAAVHPLDLPGAEAARGVLAVIDRQLAGRPVAETGERLETASLRPLPAVPRPIRNIFCVGKNYYDHAEEFSKSGFDSSAAAGAVPKAPIVFSKLPDCVVPHGAGIPIDPKVSQAIDYEAELAVIVGRGGRAIPKAEALDHVWGYAIVNDVTARDLQGRHSQWLIGKSQDGFCPMGPVATTADAFDLEDAMIRCWVNGELRQEAAMRQLIFDVPTLIETISAGITLKPGDLIATGTPAGVGIGFDPPRYLQAGDSVRIAIDGIGELENPVVAWDAARASAAA